MADLERLRRRLAREQAIRREAEAIAERATRELYARQRELELMRAVAAAANEAESIDEALRAAVDLVCAHANWPVGHAYMRERGGERLVSTDIWRLPERFEPMRAASAAHAMVPGEGLPGRVLASGRPAWIEDVTVDPNFPRAATARAVGLRSAFGFPVTVRSEAIGVLEFMSERVHAPDRALLAAMEQVGDQLGRVVERSGARDRRRRMADELARSNADLEAFASIASHDLSEPLRTASGFIELLGDRYGESLDETARTFIDHAGTELSRMRGMIEDIFEYARAGSASHAREPVALGEVVEAAETALGSRIAQTGGEVRRSQLPTVLADRGELTRVLVNLLANALKFSRPGEPPSVHVDAERRGDMWCISVTDNGVGVRESDRERIFTMLNRGQSNLRVAGTGIGLAICAKVIAAYGGEIWVEPANGHGSRFRFTLPALEGA
jgi:signal transduction histidine kinase